MTVKYAENEIKIHRYLELYDNKNLLLNKGVFIQS